jgi:hypothetical protein
LAAVLTLGIALVGPAVGAAGASAAGPESGLHVIPFPGTPDAAPQSNVIFSSLRPPQITSVTVSGSSSGIHSGRLEVLPDDAGTAFVPDTPFSGGEQVSVTATLSSPAAGTASGDPGATILRFSFTVAIPGPAAAGSAGQPTARVARRAYTAHVAPGPIQSFVSEPDLHPVAVTVDRDPDQASGDIFLTPRLTLHAPNRFGHHYHGSFAGGPMILNAAGNLVWFRPVDGMAANLEAQRYRGQPVLTWWQKSAGNRDGEDMIVDRSYRTIAVVHAGNGYSPDTHEFQITPQGTALIDAHVYVRANLSGVGGPAAGDLSDYVIQELDIRTGQLLWEWHALGHIPLSSSYYGQPGAYPYDFLHLNSIQQLPDGDLLISGRHTWGVYLIDKQTGKIIWTLGGKYSSFRIGPGAQFEWQHDAHLTGDTLTLFDDAAKPGFQEEPQSSVKAIRLDTTTMTASLVHRYTHYPPILTTSQGSAQTLPNGNTFVGWGTSPEFSEYRASGQQIFNGSFPLGVESYRAYRFPWTGDPLTRPSLGLVPGVDGSVRVYASWNGATQVAAWRVLGGSRPGMSRWLGEAGNDGFETAIGLEDEPADFAVQALDASGHVIGTSPTLADPAHVAIFSSTAFVNTSTGIGVVAAGCFTGQTCRLALTVLAGGSVLARRSSHPVPAGTGTLIDFQLSGAALRRMSQGHRLVVSVRLSDSSGAAAVRHLTLIPYTIGVSRLPRHVTQSVRVHIVQATGFVSTATGEGQVVAACYASSPCAVRVAISAGGRVVAQTAPESLGVDELGSLTFGLSAAGHAMLASAASNQLPAQVVVSDGRQRATGSIVLVGYR